VTLAREAGLQAHVQEIEHALVWYRQEGVNYSAGHVNARVRIGGQWQTIDIGGVTVLGREQPKAISDKRAVSYFYNNRGAELMAVGDNAAARQHLDAAIALEPANAAAWNNLGVLHLRSHDPPAAEQAYGSALEHAPAHAAALSNMVALYERTNNTPRAAEYLRRLRKTQLADPFHQFLLALEQEKRGDYATAIDHYRRAIRMHDQESEFHFALARSYLSIGDARRARRALARAYVLGDENTRRLHQAGLVNPQRPGQQTQVPAPAYTGGQQ